MEEAATPFPREETTPPVTKIYFGAIHVARVYLALSRRACVPSTGVTYTELSSDSPKLSNRTILVFHGNRYMGRSRNFSLRNVLFTSGEHSLAGRCWRPVEEKETRRYAQQPSPMREPSKYLNDRF